MWDVVIGVRIRYLRKTGRIQFACPGNNTPILERNQSHVTGVERVS